MKSSVAFLLFLTVFGSAAIAQRQPQRQNKSAVNKPRTETIRICQGLAVPDGYVIVAYMTSSACPHGAYVLKKQAVYESSLEVNRNEQSAAVDSSEPSNTSAAPSRSTKQPLRKSARTDPKSAQVAKTSNDPREKSAQSGNDSAPTVRSASRPRWAAGNS